MVILTVLLPVLIGPADETITLIEHRIGTEEMPQMGHRIELPNAKGVLRATVRSITHKADRTTQVTMARFRLTQEQLDALLGSTAWKVLEAGIVAKTRTHY